MKTSDIVLTFCFIGSLVFLACEKENELYPPDVQAHKTGSLTVEVYQCDTEQNPDCRDGLLPLSGARIEVIPDDPEISIDSTSTKLTLADGKTTFNHLQAGSYIVKTGYIDAEEEKAERVLADARTYHKVIFQAD